jgi:hypothetical protein
MVPLYLIAALILPAVFILWQPRTKVPHDRMRFRIAGGVVVVWLLTILMSMRSTGVSSATDAAPEVQISTQPVNPSALGDPTEAWETESPLEPSLALALGWLPGLAWTGLLWLARRAFEPEEPVPPF